MLYIKTALGKEVLMGQFGSKGGLKRLVPSKKEGKPSPKEGKKDGK
jgi:hypothetical protein